MGEHDIWAQSSLSGVGTATVEAYQVEPPRGLHAPFDRFHRAASNNDRHVFPRGRPRQDDTVAHPEVRASESTAEGSPLPSVAVTVILSPRQVHVPVLTAPMLVPCRCPSAKVCSDTIVAVHRPDVAAASAGTLTVSTPPPVTVKAPWSVWTGAEPV